MATKYLAIAGLLCLGSCLGLGLCPEKAFAQDSMMTKENGELGNKEFDKDQLPNKYEVSLGIGSIFVMIAVLKWA